MRSITGFSYLVFGLLFIGSVLWFGYWFIASSAHETAVKKWLDERHVEGWVAEYTTLDVNGFPNRFDTTLTEFHLADPESGWAWMAPQFQISSLSYKPNHFIAVWPETQKISTPQKTYTVTSDDMRASLVFKPDQTLALDRATVTLENLKIVAGTSDESSIASAVFATRPADTAQFGHDIAFDAKNFVPSEKLKARLDPQSFMPATFETMSFKSVAVFDAPWDREAIETTKPNLTKLTIQDFNAQWGEIQLQAKGDLDIDTAGYPTGQLSVRAKNWQDMIKLAVSTGKLDSNLAQSLEVGLGLMSLLSGNKNTLDVPLTFSNRIMNLGPVPIGPAPRLKRN